MKKMLGRRRRVLVHKFQYTLLFHNLGYLSVILFLFLVALFTPMIATLYGGSSPDEQLEAASSFLALHNRIWPAVGLALVLICFHSIFVSHRIAGPLRGFRRIFSALAAGDLTVRAGVRKADYLGPDAEAINEMIDGLIARTNTVERSLHQARSAFDHCLAVSEGRMDGDLTAAMARLGRLLDESAGYFGPGPSPDAGEEPEPLDTPDPLTVAGHDVEADEIDREPV